MGDTLTKFLIYLCFFCKIGNWIKNAWNKIVDALKEVANFVTDLAEKVITFIFDKVLGPVIEAVIEPVIEAVLTKFSELLKTAVSTIIPLIEKFLIDIAEPIFNLAISVLNAIWTPINFAIFTGALKFMDLLENVFDIFAGISDVTYNESKDFLLNVFFKNNVINRVFWSVTLIALAILVIFTIIAIIKNMSNLDAKQTTGQILGMSCKAMIILFLIPFMSLILLNLSSTVLRKTSEIITLTQSGENSASLGTLTFLTFTMDAARDDEYNGNATLTDELRAPYMSGKKDYAINGMNDFAIEKINYLLAFTVCIVMIFIIVLCAIVFVVKIFEVLILYITSPFFVATTVLDGGAKFKEWAKMFIAKLLGGFGMVIVMKLFFIISPIVMSDKVVFSQNPLANLLTKTLFMIGGLWAAYKSGNLIIQIVNINAAYQEAGLSSEIATRAVRAGIKYGTIAVKAVASGGATLAMDAKNIAIDAAKSAGSMVMNGEDSGAEKKEKKESNAFRGGGENKASNQLQNRIQLGAHRDGGMAGKLGNKDGMTGKASGASKLLKK